MKEWLSYSHKNNVEILENGLSSYNRQSENIKLFYIRTKDDVNQVLKRYDKFVSISKQIEDIYTFKLSDHHMTIRDSDTNKIVGYMISPYVNREPEYLMDVNGILSNGLSELIKELMRTMAPESLERYDVCVLAPKYSVYYPGLTVSVLFLKK